jgi:hypothetical protein
MKNLLVALVLIVAGVAAFGFYRGWFQVSTGDAEHKSDITISVDKDKISADEKKAKEAGHKLTHPADGKTTPESERRP